MKNILVTGGAGFIGAYLVELLSKEYKVVIVDNLKTIGGIPYINPKAEFLNFDICDSNLYNMLNQYQFEAIYHLAAQSGGETSYDDPKYDIQTNAYGTWRMAKYCVEKNIKRFIFASTVSVYGSATKDAIRETSPIAPDSIYGVSKYSGELFIQQLFKNSKSKFTIFRLFNTFGPGENLNFSKKGMISIYASFIWKNVPIIIKGSLERYRDFTYIEDSVDILYVSLTNSRSFNEVYNLASGRKTIVRELIKEMLAVSGKPANYEIIEALSTPGDSFGCYASRDKLLKDFQWKPKYSLRSGLEAYFYWINQLPVSDDLTGYHPFNLKNK